MKTYNFGLFPLDFFFVPELKNQMKILENITFKLIIDIFNSICLMFFNFIAYNSWFCSYTRLKHTHTHKRRFCFIRDKQPTGYRLQAAQYSKQSINDEFGHKQFVKYVVICPPLPLFTKKPHLILLFFTHI